MFSFVRVGLAGHAALASMPCFSRTLGRSDKLTANEPMLP